MRWNKKKIRWIKIFSCLFFAGIIICGCTKVFLSDRERENPKLSGKEVMEPVVKDLYAMDTYMTLTAYGEEAGEALEEAAAEIGRLEELFSIGNENSEIYRANKEGSAVLSQDASQLLKKALLLSESTKGAFDITILPLMEEWGFTTKKYHVPEKKDLDQLRKKVGASNIDFDEKTGVLKLESGARIDFGGIAKGYASQKVMEIYRKHQLSGGIVSLGGNVEAYGKKPDGSLFHIAIKDPKNTSSYLGVLELTDKAVITSGGYERFFEEDGKKWHHILDPKTGYPAESSLESVTIISEDGTSADGLSTALFVMGKEKAAAYWQEHADEFDVIFAEKDGSVTVSEGICDIFESERSFSILKKEDAKIR